MAEKPVPQWKKNVIEAVNIDINAVRREYHFECPKFFLNMFGVTPKDYVLAHCIYDTTVLNILVIMLLPLWIYDYLHWFWLLALCIVKAALVGVPRFILALHAATHTPFIKPLWLNTYLLEYFLCALHGIIPGMYRNHHVIMHHKENNICPRDLSSTMEYQRDNFFHFLHYYTRFQFGLIVEMPYWIYKKGLYKRFIVSTIAMIVYFASWYLIYQIKPCICYILCIATNGIQGLGLMFGNFSQHQLIDPDDYENDHALTTNVIGADYNAVAFNDGYHIIHHKYPYLHWKQLPLKFIEPKEFEIHQKYNSINFRNIDQFVIGICIMCGFYDTLYKNFLPITQKQADWTKDEFIKEIQRRLKPVKKNK